MTDPKPPRLRRCPFCGGKAAMSRDTWRTSFKFVCLKCFAMGPYSYDQADAVRAWNKRVKK